MVKDHMFVQLKTGLQSRQATSFVIEANRFHSDIFIEIESKKINAKSLIGLMSLAIKPGTKICLTIDGPDEQDALTILRRLISKKEIAS